MLFYCAKFLHDDLAVRGFSAPRVKMSDFESGQGAQL